MQDTVSTLLLLAFLVFFVLGIVVNVPKNYF